MSENERRVVERATMRETKKERSMHVAEAHQRLRKQSVAAAAASAAKGGDKEGGIYLDEILLDSEVADLYLYNR